MSIDRTNREWSQADRSPCVCDLTSLLGEWGLGELSCLVPMGGGVFAARVLSTVQSVRGLKQIVVLVFVT